VEAMGIEPTNLLHAMLCRGPAGDPLGRPKTGLEQGVCDRW